MASGKFSITACRAIEKHAIDFLYAYSHATLDDDTINLTRFLPGHELSAFIGEFYGLEGLSIFSKHQMPILFKICAGNS